MREAVECPTCSLVKRQTFSVAELEFLVRQASQFHICEFCLNWLEAELLQRVIAEISRK
jgi:hypothetical protein